MKERPILFSGSMVNAILDGRKTQTRRVMKPQPNYMNRAFETLKSMVTNISKRKCPYGEVGDRLYVREKWQPLYEYCNPDGGIIGACFRHRGGGRVFNTKHNPSRHIDDTYPRKPSIHMPKWAAGIWLEIFAIRYERVQDISIKDAKAEGCVGGEPLRTGKQNGRVTAKFKFIQLWDSINKKRGYGWEVNPWVWVVEFKKIKTI